MVTKNSNANARTIILIDGSGSIRKVLVPAESKITFGPAIPGPANRGGYEGVREYAVRVYEGTTEKSGLLAVFTGVREFRDEEIKISKLVIQEAGEEMWKNDEGGYKVVRKVKKSHKLLPDEF